jgi:uracil-DNA glycosylase
LVFLPKMTTYPFVAAIGYTDEKCYRCNHQAYQPVDVSDKIHPLWIEFFKTHNYNINERLRYLYVNAYELAIFRRKGLEVRPLPEDVMNVFSMDPTSIKVVILGQDPYPGYDFATKRPVANGLAFSTHSTKITSSLETMFAAIRGVKHEVDDFTLSGWVKQGVFLLNMVPILWTIRTSMPGVEAVPNLDEPERIWGDITKNICLFIHSLTKDLSAMKQVQFLLFGNKTHCLKQSLPTQNCFASPHPSGRNTQNAFTDEPFSQTSSIVDWRQA